VPICRQLIYEDLINQNSEAHNGLLPELIPNRPDMGAVSTGPEQYGSTLAKIRHN
jgi:hypothetical protein